MQNENLITVRELAQVIKESGYKVGVRKLFEKLHEWGMVWETALNRKEPTREAIKSGYLKKGESKGMDIYGRQQTTIVVMVTEKGKEFILDTLKKELE